MRLAQLDLIRYGHFTDRTLTFPKTPVDLHLIFGPNEAGKSTLRKSIIELFYGIERTTPLGFLHGMSEMVIGGTLENGGAPLTFRRFKRTKNPLVDATGNPFGEADLVQWLGGTNKEFFERNYGLDHPTLEAGSRAMLNSADDVGQMLYQTAHGLPGMHKVRETLDAEAYALWGKIKRGDAAYYIALQDMESAQSRLNEVRVSTSKWLAAKKAFEKTTRDASQAATAHRLAENARERLERIQRVSPAVQQMRGAVSERAALGSPTPLPGDAAATLAAAERKIAQAETQQSLLAPRLAQENAALAEVRQNPMLLAHKDAILGLAGRVTEFLQAATDLPTVTSQFDAKCAGVQGFAAQVGWPERELAAIAAKVPSRVVRAEIEELLRNRVTVEGDAARARQAEQDQGTALGTLDALLTGSTVRPPSPALETALNAGRVLDLAHAETTAQQKVAAADRALQAALAALPPWTGPLATLRTMVLPPTAEVQRISKERDTLAARSDMVNDQLRAKQAEAVRSKVTAEDARRNTEALSAEALLQRRGRRDEIWQTIRSGAQDPAAAGDALEAEIAGADTLADNRYANVAVVAQAQALDTEHRTVLGEVQLLQAQAAEATGALTTLLDNWATRMSALGVPGIAIDGLPQWAKDRETALSAAQALDAATSELAALLTRAEATAARLRDALSAAGDNEPVAELDLATLILRAEIFDRAQVALRAELKERQTQRVKLADALPGLAAKTTHTADVLRQWQAEWTRKIAAAGLAPDIGVAGVQTALELFTQMETDCHSLLEVRTARMAPMQRAIDRFTNDATTLAATCLPEIAGRPATEIVAELSEQLQRAQLAHTEYGRLTVAIAATTRDHEQATTDAALALATITPLMAVANVTTREELRAAITLADACRSADHRARAAEEAAINAGGGGIPLQRLIEEVDSEDPALVAGRLDDALTARNKAQEHRDECIRLHTLAEDTYTKIAGEDEAAKAESLRQDALLAMGNAVDEYVRITVASKLLRRAVERYREEKQEPLLARASALFSTLTCGSFDKLSLDFDVEPVRLTAHRSKDGGPVSLNGLSTGTDDQLFLALRLAALELHLATATPLPFIADDIVINMDTARTGAVLAVLAQLATKTQVLVLSHDENIIELAKRATNGNVTIHHL